MIVEYEMRPIARYGFSWQWAVMHGRFANWRAFEDFVRRNKDEGREVRNSRKVKERALT